MGTVTRTVLFTDLTGYTERSAGLDREGLHQLLAWHKAQIAPITSRYGGRVVKNLGDSYMVLFDSATDALRASVDIQESVTSDGAGAPIKIGMNTGDVEAIDDDAFGEAVNLARRIVDQTLSGEIYFGAATKLCMNASEIPWETVGRFRLRGVPGDTEIFRAVPRHRAWLPDAVCAAVKMGTLVRIRRGERPPLLPAEPVVLLEGFAPGSDALEQAVGSLPVLNPSALWLCTYNIAQSDRMAWLEGGRGLVIGTPNAIDAALEEAFRAQTKSAGSDTIVFDVGTNADFELVMCGLAMPQVPLHEVVASYSYDLLPNGQWVNRSDRAVLRVELTPEGLVARALAPGVSVNGRGLLPGSSVALGDRDSISTAQGAHTYREVEDNEYCGILTRDTDMRLGLVGGQVAELGREPRHPGLAFPDRRGQENIRWCAGPRAARARANGFTLDRALAGRHQASVQITGDAVQLTPLHRKCPTYVVSKGDNRMTLAERQVPLMVGDDIIAGTTVVGLRAVD